MPQESQNQSVSIYYLTEEHPYSLQEIAEKLDLPDKDVEVAKSIIKKLRKDCDKLCSIVNSGTGELEKRCKFSFVGFAELRFDQINSRLVFFLPKFLPEENRSIKLKDHCKMLLRAILKYDKKRKDNTPFSSNQIINDDTLISNRLGIWLTLVFDWMEHGTYLVEQSLLEENGEGEINWEETIAQKLPFLQNRRPVYMEYLTQCNVEDSCHYITRLHEFLVSKCYKELDSLGLAEALGLFCEAHYEGELSDFGEKDYILSRLNGELGNQFIDTKRNTLNWMKAVVDEEFNGKNDLNAQFLGMQGFHGLWERAIKEVYGDQLDQSINAIQTRLVSDKDTNTTFAAYIEPPRWCPPNANRSNNSQGVMGFDTGDGEASRLKPDFVAITEKDNQKYMVILDAKYYLPKFSPEGAPKMITNQPGVGDVNKQFLYQLAYKNLIVNNNLKVYNAFIFPRACKDNTMDENYSTPKLFATIEVEMFAEWFKQLNNNTDLFPTELQSYEIDGLALLSDYEQHRKRMPLEIFIPPQQTTETNDSPTP